MSKDIEVIHELERTLKRRIHRNMERVRYESNSYVLDNLGNVIKLSLPSIQTKEFPPPIFKLKYLQKLFLNRANITHLLKNSGDTILNYCQKR